MTHRLPPEKDRHMKEFVACALLMCLLGTGCKENSNPVADVPVPSKKTAWIGIVFHNPIANTTDANAVMASGVIASMNAQATATWLRPFDTIASVSFKNIDQWTLVNGSVTEVLTRTVAGDSAFGCVLNVSGKVSGTTYTNTPAYADSNRADGKYGYWAEYYLPTSPRLRLHEFSYTVDAQGTRTGKDVYNETGPQTVIVDSANGSGTLVRSTLVASTFFVATFKAQWLSDGSGQWTSYDIQAKMTGTGIWGK
jgi:hypothetical protein